MFYCKTRYRGNTKRHVISRDTVNRGPVNRGITVYVFLVRRLLAIVHEESKELCIVSYFVPTFAGKMGVTLSASEPNQRFGSLGRFCASTVISKTCFQHFHV